MNKTQSVVITGTTTIFALDGTKQNSYPSPRMTLDAQGAVVLEERLSPAGALVIRRQFGRDERLEVEDRLNADGTLDYRITYRYNDGGQLAEEVMSFGDGTLHNRWIHHRDKHGRLLERELVDRDGRSELTEIYSYTADARSATAQRGSVGEWTYRYDETGRVIGKTGGPVSGDDEDQEAIEYQYDARHRLVREVSHYSRGRGPQSLVMVQYP